MICCIIVMDYHTIINNQYNNYVTHSTEVKHGNKMYYIMAIYDDNHSKRKLIIKFRFTVIGTYSRNENIWLWSDQSIFLDKAMKAKVSKMRTKIFNLNISTHNDKLTNKTMQDMLYHFAGDDFSILPTKTKDQIFSIIMETMNINIYTHHRNNKIDYLMIDRIIHDSMVN